jgi:hypothetical protein
VQIELQERLAIGAAVEVTELVAGTEVTAGTDKMLDVEIRLAAIEPAAAVVAVTGLAVEAAAVVVTGVLILLDCLILVVYSKIF